jgi:hypothetical protein
MAVPYGDQRAMDARRPPKLARYRSGVQPQLLRPPVEQFADMEFVFGGAGNFVDPAELAKLLAGPAQPAEHLAGEVELMDPARSVFTRKIHYTQLVRQCPFATWPGVGLGKYA